MVIVDIIIVVSHLPPRRRWSPREQERGRAWSSAKRLTFQEGSGTKAAVGPSLFHETALLFRKAETAQLRQEAQSSLRWGSFAFLRQGAIRKLKERKDLSARCVEKRVSQERDLAIELQKRGICKHVFGGVIRLLIISQRLFKSSTSSGSRAAKPPRLS